MSPAHPAGSSRKSYPLWKTCDHAAIGALHDAQYNCFNNLRLQNVSEKQPTGMMGCSKEKIDYSYLLI